VCLSRHLQPALLQRVLREQLRAAHEKLEALVGGGVAVHPPLLLCAPLQLRELQPAPPPQLCQLRGHIGVPLPAASRAS
jgi:hypothetical protein